MIHGLRTNTKVAEGWMAVKTDMSKAYDRVEWNFLEVLLERMGFDRIWVRWIMACVSSVSFSVLMNGNSHGHIKPERGIRQGDPLSPFLFILCAEALVSCLNSAEEAGRISGVKLSTSCPSVHHLLFADDSLLLCKASVEEATELMDCLRLYGEASGQVVNKLKSSVIFGSLVPETTKNEIKSILGIEVEGGEGYYLGLPECFSGSKRKLLSFIREKLQGQLQGWFSKSLSQGGKEILLKSVCLALPVYAMSCFKLPKEVCTKLTSAMIEFWWSSGNNRKKIPWVAWQKLCKDKDKGGLGFKDIEKFNQSLLAKQAWRLLSSPDSLVARILKHRYFARSSFLECSVGTRPSYAWRSIVHGRELLKQGLFQQIGDGRSTKVWLDNWVIDPIPRPPKYNQEAVVDLSLTVRDLIDVNTGSWNVSLVRQLIAEEDVALVLNCKCNMTRSDAVRWGFTQHGRYDSKSGYKLIEILENVQSGVSSDIPPFENLLWKRLWKTKTSPKLRHFLWRVMSGALAVKAQLQSRGIPLDSTCSVCHQGAESVCHVLFQCTTAQEVLRNSGIPTPLAGWSSNSVLLNLHYLLTCSQNQALGMSTRLAFPWLLWQLWKARTKFCFEQVIPVAHVIASLAKDEAAIWLNLHGVLTGILSPPLEAPVPSLWVKPPSSCLKCNVGSSWSASSGLAGASWLLRDSKGSVLLHSRRSFSGVPSKPQGDLLALTWAAESMLDLKKCKIIFEFSSVEAIMDLKNPSAPPNIYHARHKLIWTINAIQGSSLQHAPEGCNSPAVQIADSVVHDHRLQVLCCL